MFTSQKFNKKLNFWDPQIEIFNLSLAKSNEAIKK
jgi:hypothetical protein